jgi:hypothetical protein
VRLSVRGKIKVKVANLKLPIANDQYTHWKQTVMYTQDTIAVNVSPETLRMKRNHLFNSC